MWFCVEGGFSLKVVDEAALLVQSKAQVHIWKVYPYREHLVHSLALNVYHYTPLGHCLL